MDPQQQFVQGTTIPNLAFEQDVNTTLPPFQAIETWADSWTNEEKITLEEHYDYHKKMMSFLESARITGSFSEVPKPPKKIITRFYQ